VGRDGTTGPRDPPPGSSNMGVAPGDRVALLSATRQNGWRSTLRSSPPEGSTVPIYPSSLTTNAATSWRTPSRRSCSPRTRSSGEDRGGQDPWVRARRREAAVGLKAGSRSTRRTDAESLAGLMSRGRRPSRPSARRSTDASLRSAAMRSPPSSIHLGDDGAAEGRAPDARQSPRDVEATLPLGVVREGDVDFFFLPPRPLFARLIEYVGIAAGSPRLARSIDTLLEDMSPPAHTSSQRPRIYEKVYGRVLAARGPGARSSAPCSTGPSSSAGAGADTSWSGGPSPRGCA